MTLCVWSLSFPKYLAKASTARRRCRKKKIRTDRIDRKAFSVVSSFDECYKNRVIAVIDGVRVSLISLAKLKKNKKASGRHKDLDDLEHLP